MPDKEPKCGPNERTVREISVELDGLRKELMAKIEAIEKLAEERKSWYEDRDRDRQAEVGRALTGVRELTKQSFESSEKAIGKAEEAQRSYNQTHNDLTRKMEQQRNDTMPRAEIESRFRSMEEKINDLRESRSEGAGSKNQTIWIVGLLVALAGIAAVIVAELIRGK